MDEVPLLEAAPSRRTTPVERALALAVAALLAASLAATAAHDDGTSRVVALAGAIPSIDGDHADVLPPPSLPLEPPPVTPPPDVTVPPVRPPRPKVTVPTVPPITVPPVTVPPVPVGCAPRPAPFEPEDTGIYTVPTAGGAGRFLMPLTSSPPQLISYSPDGRRIAYTRYPMDDTDGDPDISMHIASAGGTGERRVAEDIRHPLNVAWSPDGRYIAFRATSWEAGKLSTYVLEADTGYFTSIVDHGSEVTFLRWSKDGKYLAWGGGRSNPGVWVADIYGDFRVAKVADDAVMGVTWSPDGRQLAFGKDGGGVHLVNRDGSGRRMVHPKGYRVAWSPTTRSHLVVDTGGTLFLVDPDLGVPLFLATAHLHGWLADGSRVVTTSREGIHLVGLDGCKHTVVTGTGSTLGLRDWSPDSSTILFGRFR